MPSYVMLFRQVALHKKRTSIGLLCDADKKSIVSSFDVVTCLDNFMIRFALSLQGASMPSLRRGVRHILAEQLVVVKSGHCPAQGRDLHKASLRHVLASDHSPSEVQKTWCQVYGMATSGNMK